MEDREVIEAFVALGARQAYGPSVHIEGDALMLAGWWHLAFRVAHDAFIVRNEEPPEPTEVPEVLTRQLAAHDLTQVGVDLPAITAITYTALSLGSVSWALWAEDLAAGEEALAARAGVETFFGAPAEEEPEPSVFSSAEIGGARRLAGLPATLVLTVGIDTAAVDQLQAGLPDCQFVSKAFGEIIPEACGSLVPSVVVVDATEVAGREFAMELRASACGRFLPVVAVSGGAGVPLGADVAVDPAEPPATWAEPIRALLP